MNTTEQAIFYHTENTIHTNERSISFEVKSQEPLVAVLENVLSDEECEALIELSKNRLERSKIGKN